MADPVVPNFVSGIGRLATDRFTYEKHTNGTDDRHQAGQIDLFPTVVIGSTKTNVQDAIAAISLAIGTPPPDASTTVKGIVKLSGDIAGTATSVSVTKIQGKPISTSVPNSGDVLTWDGSVWKPQSITGTFVNLNVSGNTILGTNSSNTLLVNAQTTLSNNLTVNGDINLGNSSSDIIIITGDLLASGGTNISISCTDTAIFSASNSISINCGGDAFLSANNMNITGGTTNLISSTLNLLGSTISMQSTGSNNVNTIILNPLTLTSLRGNTEQTNGNFTIGSAATFNIAANATTNILSDLIMAGTSKITRRIGGGPNSDSNIFPGLYDIYLATNFITNGRQWIIDETTYPATQTGIEFEIINYGIHTITVLSPSPFFTSIAVIPASFRVVFIRKPGSNGWSLLYKHTIST